MTVMTKSSFIYGTFFDSSNKYIDFDEGGGELTAEIVGDYAFDEVAEQIQLAMNDVGTLTYTVTHDLTTKKIIISADGNFDLLTNSGTHSAQSALNALGFDNQADLTGTDEYVSDNISVTEYAPQFYLQGYVDFDDYIESVSATTNISADGQNVESISFGDAYFMECNIKYANDGILGATDDFTYNANGVAQLRSFMNYVRLKRKVMFIKDISTPSAAIRCILESSEGNSTGTGFKLKEMYGQGLPNFFETGKLKFRKVV